VALPDQDVVDEIGRALGVERASDAVVRSSEELLHDRDRRRWQLEATARTRALNRTVSHPATVSELPNRRRPREFERPGP
jgi:Family of unknown function (DUF6335)